MNTSETPFAGRKSVIYGTPITPRHLIDELAGSSFCVSYWNRSDLATQLDRVIELVGDDEILLVDNGAFSAYTSGTACDWDYWQGFVEWSDAIAARCPQAIVVAPDVIGGSVEENVELYHDFLASSSVGPERVCVVWHLDEPLALLRYYLEGGAAMVAIGSSGRFWKPGTKAWHNRVAAVFRFLDAICDKADGLARPHVHMMRAQSHHARYPFDSSDSTNVAANHCRYRHEGEGHLGRFAGRVRERIQATATGEARVETPRELAEGAAGLAELLATLPNGDPDLEPPPAAPAAVQRWRERRHAWRPAGELLDPRRYAVDLVAERQARAFVLEHHYSGSFPAARRSFGLFRDLELVGVAVFSVPMNPRTVPKWTGQASAAGVELGRFVLLDEVPANGESWFLARAFEGLEAELGEVRAVVSFADPAPRRTAGGRVICPGHVGTIYQAHNGRYCGRARRETLIMTPDARVLSRRSLSKIRNDERGAAGAVRALEAAGAPPRRAHETGPAYVERALAEGPFVRHRHPGNHVYAWPIGDRRVRKAVHRATPDGGAYPKHRDAPLEAVA